MLNISGAAKQGMNGKLHIIQWFKEASGVAGATGLYAHQKNNYLKLKKLLKIMEASAFLVNIRALPKN